MKKNKVKHLSGRRILAQLSTLNTSEIINSWPLLLLTITLHISRSLNVYILPLSFLPNTRLLLGILFLLTAIAWIYYIHMIQVHHYKLLRTIDSVKIEIVKPNDTTLVKETFILIIAEFIMWLAISAIIMAILAVIVLIFNAVSIGHTLPYI